MEPDTPHEYPITGELDLHTFRPQEVISVVREYIFACQEKGIHDLRIVHGKGIGTLRETVHAELRRHPAVLRFALAPPEAGGWGATRVQIKPGRLDNSGDMQLSF